MFYHTYIGLLQATWYARIEPLKVGVSRSFEVRDRIRDTEFTT